MPQKISSPLTIGGCTFGRSVRLKLGFWAVQVCKNCTKNAVVSRTVLTAERTTEKFKSDNLKALFNTFKIT